MICAFDLQNMLDNVHDMFNVWLKCFNKNEINLAVVGISAIVLTILKLRN